jgi:hypothetical protein
VDGVRGDDFGREKLKFSKLKEEFSFSLAQEFLTLAHVVPLLRQPGSTPELERSTELRKIIKNAGDFACELLEQNPAMLVRSKKYFENIRFYIDSQEMRHHPIHLLDEDNKSFDGRRIDMVIFPGIVAYGNENGENYGTPKIWCKAVVCMLDDPDPNREEL